MAALLSIHTCMRKLSHTHIFSLYLFIHETLPFLAGLSWVHFESFNAAEAQMSSCHNICQRIFAIFMTNSWYFTLTCKSFENLKQYIIKM